MKSAVIQKTCRSSFHSPDHGFDELIQEKTSLSGKYLMILVDIPDGYRLNPVTEYEKRNYFMPPWTKELWQDNFIDCEAQCCDVFDASKTYIVPEDVQFCNRDEDFLLLYIGD